MTSWREDVGVALGAHVTGAARVTGGDIHDAFRATLADGRDVFVKVSRGPAPPKIFAAEAAGLAWLADAGALAVPEVLAVHDADAPARTARAPSPPTSRRASAGDRAIAGTPDRSGWLALAWLDLAERGPRFLDELGRGLARLHAAGAPSFGLASDNYLATIPQPRSTGEIWPEFWVEHRLRPLCARAAALGHAPTLDARLDALLAHPDRFGPPEPPARLHGDLWWGNVAAVGGAPVIFDPAVYGGHREVDLAMLALFGDLPDALTSAYAEVSPLAAGWRDRLPLWQLYPLAAHAVLFGGGYGAQLARGLARLTA